MTVEVYVRRKIRDLVRDAAEDVLRARWPSVGRVDRAEVWTFVLDSPEGRDGVRHAMEHTTLVANPNVHRWAIHEGEDPAPPDGSARVIVTVTDRVDPRGASVLRSMRDRAVRWTIDTAGSREEAERMAREVTGADGRGAGLLANPHAQEVETAVAAR
jgi:phosphoribosylformylglycinamidine (FGAM) synthase PurS component